VEPLKAARAIRSNCAVLRRVIGELLLKALEGKEPVDIIKRAHRISEGEERMLLAACAKLDEPSFHSKLTWKDVNGIRARAAQGERRNQLAKIMESVAPSAARSCATGFGIQRCTFRSPAARR
jgi:hypothetical protein